MTVAEYWLFALVAGVVAFLVTWAVLELLALAWRLLAAGIRVSIRLARVTAYALLARLLLRGAR